MLVYVMQFEMVIIPACREIKIAYIHAARLYRRHLVIQKNFHVFLAGAVLTGRQQGIIPIRLINVLWTDTTLYYRTSYG